MGKSNYQKIQKRIEEFYRKDYLKHWKTYLITVLVIAGILFSGLGFEIFWLAAVGILLALALVGLLFICVVVMAIIGVIFQVVPSKHGGVIKGHWAIAEGFVILGFIIYTVVIIMSNPF